MNWGSLTHVALRIVAGLMFFQHGYQKLFGLAGRGPSELATQSGVGGLIEFFGGLLIAIGLQTRWAAFVCSGMMAVAFWQFHAFGSAWDEHGALGLLPMVNGGELAVLYCFVFLYLWARGGGGFSIDERLRRRRS